MPKSFPFSRLALDDFSHPIFLLGCIFGLVLSCGIKDDHFPDLIETKTQFVHNSLPSPDEISLLPPDGGLEFNRLIFESSPYLLQHARNPIEWRSWNSDTLALALKENKPIFLSIGYTTCHWCHVMERESFEDPEVAQLINQDYIAIKVDREERPDLDHIYMSVTQMMTGRGGWPMTVIMTPEKVPFFAGTYFPKSSMLQLLPHFARVWQEDREKVDEIGQAIISNLASSQSNQAGGDLNSTFLDRCYDSLCTAYDPVHGGFGEQPKFPTPHALSFLLRYYHRTGEVNALEMVTHTLTQIRLSGTYDQIGLGIHRYSTDQKWLVPHFEKMLYDQALFAIACLETYQVTGDSFFKDACQDTLSYVDQKLSDPLGGFYCAEDADSEGEEGKFYLWTTEELENLLGERDASFFGKLYRFEGEGNYLDEASGQKTGTNIPHLHQRLDAHALNNQLPANEFFDRITQIQTILFQHREKRIHPQLDDKVLTDWNGLMISAFAQAGQAFGNETYIQRAKQAADFCLNHLRLPNGRLLKRWRLGSAGLPAHLEDYAFFAQGLLDLYEAGQNPQYLFHAKAFIDQARELFEDDVNGGFFLTSKDGEKLLTRPKEIYDGAIPSGNSIMAMNLARIWKMTGDEQYHHSLNKSFSAFSGFLQSNPSGAENFLHALAFVLSPPEEIVVTGDPQNAETRAFLEEIKKPFLPFKTLLHLSPSNEHKKIMELAPYLTALKSDEQPTFFLCQDYSCQKPLTQLKEVKQSLERLTRREQPDK